MVRIRTGIEQYILNNDLTFLLKKACTTLNHRAAYNPSSINILVDRVDHSGLVRMPNRERL